MFKAIGLLQKYVSHKLYNLLCQLNMHINELQQTVAKKNSDKNPQPLHCAGQAYLQDS